MKKVYDTLFIIFNVIAITLTLYLLNINETRVCQVGSYSIISLENEIESENLKKGTLLFARQENAYQTGDKVFYTKNNQNHRETTVETIQNSESKNGKKIYILENGYEIDETKINGVVDNTIKIPFVGIAINCFEQENVYIVAIIIPLCVLFVYQFVFQATEKQEEAKAKVMEQKQKKKNARIAREIREKEKQAREKFENLRSDEENFNELKEIEKQYIKLLKYGNGVNDIDINEYYKTR